MFHSYYYFSSSVSFFAAFTQVPLDPVAVAEGDGKAGKGVRH